MIRLISIIKEILAEQTAAGQAKAMGLVSKGFGNWADPNTGEVIYRTVKGKLVPVSGEETPKSTPQEINPSSRQELKKLLKTVKTSIPEAFDDIEKKWRGDVESSFGPPPKDAPKIDISPDEPLIGKAQDIHFVGRGGNYIFYGDITADIVSISEEDGNFVERNMSKKIETDVDGLLEAMKNLGTWQDDATYSMYPKRAEHARDKFVEYAQELVPPRINLETPIVRGVALDVRIFETVVDDFQIGNTISFNEPFAFSTNGEQIPKFMGDSPIKMVIRIHPADDGKHSGVYIPSVRSAFYNATTDYAESTPDIDPKLKARFNEYSESEFDGEDEFLVTPGVKYDVVGVVRVLTSGWTDEVEKIMMIDLKEKTKTINVITKSYLNRPLDIRKVKKGSKTNR